jgi:hypothetical protein
LADERRALLEGFKSRGRNRRREKIAVFSTNMNARLLALLALLSVCAAREEVLGISWDIDPNPPPSGVYEFAANGSARELAPFSDTLQTLDSVYDEDTETLHLVVGGSTLMPFHASNRSFSAAVDLDCSGCDESCCFGEWFYAGAGKALTLALGWRSPPSGTFTNAVLSVDLSTGNVQEVVPFDNECAVITAASAYSRKSSTLWAWLSCNSRNASIVEFDIAHRVKRNDTWLDREFAVSPVSGKLLVCACV